MKGQEPGTPVCRACGAATPRPLASFGRHPVSSRFRRPSDAPAPAFDLAMSRCQGCGSVQLTVPVPLEALEPVPDWLRFSEPGAHLPAVAGALASASPAAARRVLGLGPDDEPLLAHLTERGSETARIPWPALGATSATPRPAAIHQLFTPDLAREIRARQGGATLVVARYLLEHAPDAGAFLRAIEALLEPGGSVLLEVPDCSQAFLTHDYTTLWEEHVFYFTPGSLRRALASRGWRVEWIRSYDNPLHNALVVEARPGGTPEPGAVPDDERAMSDGFAAAWPATRDRVRAWCEGEVHAGRRVALFGAGHVGLTFLIAMGIEALLTCAIDDSPAKQGLLLPGTALDVRGSASLEHADVSTLLLAVSPAAEAAVLARLAGFIARGGRVASIFPSSPLALPVLTRA